MSFLCKNQTSVFFIILLLSFLGILFSSPNNNEIEESYFDQVKISININEGDFDYTDFLDATLQHNTHSDLLYKAEIGYIYYHWFMGGEMYYRYLFFNRVVDGIYTLTINTKNHLQYTDKEFIVNDDRETKSIVLSD